MHITFNQEQNLKLTPVNRENVSILLNLAQGYEAEFSTITGKKPKPDGTFSLETMPNHPNSGYLLYKEETPIGFAVVNTKSTPQDVGEFYVIPLMRWKKIGMQFAHALFRKHPGAWQVRQIEGADLAIKFWRYTISSYTNNNYQEETIKDLTWGTVTRQTFFS